MQSAILIPIFANEKTDTRKVIELIEAHVSVGPVHVVNQGKRIHFPSEETNEIFVQHHPAGLGTWGSLHFAYDLIVENQGLSPVEIADIVAVNLAFMYYPADIVRELLEFTEKKSLDHVVGRRNDIAASLSTDPNQGYVRGILECFFGSLASVMLTSEADLFKDSFSGLHCFSKERYLASKWHWVHFTNWGGALQSQIQTHLDGFEKGYMRVGHDVKRDWSSVTYGDDPWETIVAMMDKARELPIFAEATEENLQKALADLHVSFSHQSWMDKSTEQKMRSYLDYYNQNTKKAPFLQF